MLNTLTLIVVGYIVGRIISPNQILSIIQKGYEWIVSLFRKK